MATKKGNQRSPGQSNLPGRRLVDNRVPERVLVTPSDGQKSAMGFLIALIAMVLVFCLMLPIVGIMYFDTLSTQKESKAQIERMERLRKQLEEERKKMDQANRKEE